MPFLNRLLVSYSVLATKKMTAKRILAKVDKEMAVLSKKMLLIATISSLLMMLSACGDKSQEGAVKKITEKAEEINGYKAKMEMTMKTGEKDQSYDVNAWYKQGETDLYRVG